MSRRVVRVALAATLALCSWGSRIEAQGIVTHPYPGITYITRTESLPAFQCPGCPTPTPSPRLARMNIVLVDLQRTGNPFQVDAARHEPPGRQSRFHDTGMAAPAAPI